MPVSKRRIVVLLGAFGVCAGVLTPTLILPVANRLQSELEERRLNKMFRERGINGRATFEGRLFEGTMSIVVSEIKDAQFPALAEAVADERRIIIAESLVSWRGLRCLTTCHRLRYIIFVDVDVSDADLEALQTAMPGCRVTAKWRSGRYFGPPDSR